MDPAVVGRTQGEDRLSRLLVISHKETYASESGYSFTGGFALQIGTICRLFDRTIVVTALKKGAPPKGALPIVGPGLKVTPLPEPRGSRLFRKLGLLIWLPRNWGAVVREMRRCDQVHCLVPGDLGALGLLTALLLRKPLWVRHCGTWGNRETLADRFLMFLLPRIVGRGVLVQATGGGVDSPPPGRDGLNWIFSTSISEDEVRAIERTEDWRGGTAPVLVCIGRLSPGKNVVAAVRTLSLLTETFPESRLEILGTGSEEDSLRLEANRSGLSSANTIPRQRRAFGRSADLLSGTRLALPDPGRRGLPEGRGGSVGLWAARGRECGVRSTRIDRRPLRSNRDRPFAGGFGGRRGGDLEIP